MRRLLWILVATLTAVLLVLVVKNDEMAAAGLSQSEIDSFAFKITLVVVVGALVLAPSHERFSRAVESALVWVAAALVLAMGYGYRFELREVADRMFSELMLSHAAGRSRVVEVTRGGQKNFSVTAQLNSAHISMVLDTGASSVILTQDAARAAGLPVEVLTYTVPVETANGRARAAPVTLDSLSVGGIVERAVPALIARPGQLQTNLLGMSFLNRLESWEVRGDKLVMRGYP